MVWGFSQPIADNMEEAVSGVKGQLATKIYGEDLRVLEDKAEQIVNVMRTVRGITDLGIFRVVGQPNDNFVVDRQQPRAIKSTSRTFRMPLIPPREGMLSLRYCKARRATTW